MTTFATTQKQNLKYNRISEIKLLILINQNLIKMKFLKKLHVFLLAALAVGLVGCNKNDSGDNGSSSNSQYAVGGEEAWGKTMRGDDLSIGAFPDMYAYYWEYTFDASANPNIGLRVEGEYPDARFFNYNVYDDIKQYNPLNDSGIVTSLEDIDVRPNEGSVNPFCNAGEKKQYYTVYFLPQSVDAAKYKDKNVCWFGNYGKDDMGAESWKNISVFLRYYIPSVIPFAGVELPTITAFNVVTGEDVELPKRQVSTLHSITIPGGAFASSENMAFMRAPLSLLFPNEPAEYLFNRNNLESGKLLFFNVKVPSYPKSIADYTNGNADMRYWSMCIGAETTYSYFSICDYETKVDENGFAWYVIADLSDENADQVKALCEERGYNFMPWDRAKVVADANAKGVPNVTGEEIMVLYRNLMFDGYEYSIREKMQSIDMNNPMNIDPMTMIALYALGDYGPTGKKMSFDAFIEGGAANLTLRPNQGK